MIQIDMDIPKTCNDCPFHIYHSGKNYVCVATPLFYPMNLANYKDGRKDFCPFKEVKDNTATWEQLDNEPDTFFTMHQYKCSNCGKIQVAKSKNIKNFRYCSKCGADMRKAKK